MYGKIFSQIGKPDILQYPQNVIAEKGFMGKAIGRIVTRFEFHFRPFIHQFTSDEGLPYLSFLSVLSVE